MDTPDLRLGSKGNTNPASSTAQPDADVSSDRFEPEPGIASAPSDLKAIGLLELFEADERPILVYDLDSSSKHIPVYYNEQLDELHVAGLKLGGKPSETVIQTAKGGKHSEFTNWVLTAPSAGPTPIAVYCDIKWTSQTLRNRWRIIAGEVGSQAVDISKFLRPERPRLDRSQTISPVKQQRPRSLGISPQGSVEAQLEAFTLHRGDSISLFPTAQETKLRSTPAKPKKSPGSYDVLLGNPLVENSAHIEFFLSFDWASTELGPIDSWSLGLRRMTNLLLTDPRPAAMYWGENRIMLYNEPYILVTGQKHPFMMGKPFEVAWAEIKDDFSPSFNRGYETGIAATMDNALFYIERHGYLEETYYSISLIPLGTSEGHMAFYNPVFDTTRQVLAERRMAFLLRLGQFIASSREPKDFWRLLLRGLEPDHPDVPFAILYSAGAETNEEVSVSSERSQNLKIWALEGAVRVLEGAPNIPGDLNSDSDLDNFLPNFLDLIKTDSPTILFAKDGTLPSTLISDLKVAANGDICEAALFLPIRSTTENALGFLIIGINPRKRYDDDYQLFINLLSRQLATSIAATVLFEEETIRARVEAEQANLDRNLLSRKLAIQTHETLEIESRFRRMADLAPVGMFHFNPQGCPIYANEHYFDLTEHQRGDLEPLSFYKVILEEDHLLMDREWDKLVKGGQPVTFEIRLKKLFEAEDSSGGQRIKGPSWIIAAAYPEKAEDGTIVGILGCITDISKQKWAEGFQQRKMLEAVELKRQQENFIDMTSHEMRNPLSAIIQCADMINTALSEFDAGSTDLLIPREVVDGHLDAAQTIILCAQHQKRIIDDILTLSKLDSDLLLITPVEVQPVSVIESALKIFNGELQKADMELRFKVESSYSELAVEWVKLDPSRMLQVLINLVTNAIKFTQSEATRQISISLGASLDHPAVRNEVQYLPRGSVRSDMASGPEWGTGQKVYLYIEVQDSGRGLTDHERALLFQRFSQASPRTHVQYGGSGLGLFISRELTELQGGQIGVASTAGVGSTFAFYVRARRCPPPETGFLSSPQLVGVKAQRKILSTNALTRLEDSPVSPRTSRSTQDSPPLTPPRHILIVEDNIVNQKVLSKQLRNAGCIVHVANHGVEALDFLATTRFWIGQQSTGVELSVVLMDLEMPVMDGLTCVKKIRDLQEEGMITGHVPVIAVTANARSEQIATAKDSGMDSVVTKPFRIPELMPEMERQMNRGSERPDGLGRAASAPL